MNSPQRPRMLIRSTGPRIYAVGDAPRRGDRSCLAAANYIRPIARWSVERPTRSTRATYEGLSPRPSMVRASLTCDGLSAAGDCERHSDLTTFPPDFLPKALVPRNRSRVGKSHGGNNGHPPTFEDLIYTVERLPYLFETHYYDAVWRRAPPFEKPFFQLSVSGSQLKRDSRVSLYDLQMWSTNFVLDYVAHAVITETGEDARSLIDCLCRNARLALFSLNYDSSIIDLERYWWTSFRTLDATEAQMHDSGAGVQIFESHPDIPSDVNAFIQLHGSTYFGWIAHPYRAPIYVPCRSARPLDRKRATPRRNGFEQWNDRTALPATLMITGYRKGEKILVEPYAGYYHYLRNEAFRSPNWLILGYGGGDPHINSVLTSASDFWGNKLRAFVCNYADPPIEASYLPTILASKCLYLGANARAFKNGPIRITSTGQVMLGSSVRLSLDGRFESHYDEMLAFFK